MDALPGLQMHASVLHSLTSELLSVTSRRNHEFQHLDRGDRTQIFWEGVLFFEAVRNMLDDPQKFQLNEYWLAKTFLQDLAQLQFMLEHPTALKRFVDCLVMVLKKGAQGKPFGPVNQEFLLLALGYLSKMAKMTAGISCEKRSLERAS